MPNKIFIEYKSISQKISRAGSTGSIIFHWTPKISDKVTLELPLTTDITIEASSDWAKLSDFVPEFFGKVLNIMNTVQSAGGSVSKSFLDFKNKLDLPFWQGSPPVKINVQIGFFTKTDAKKDVFDPIKEIVGLSIISRDPDNPKKYITPGINLKNFNSLGKDEKSATRKGKVVSFEIPGVVYLPIAIIELARPTFSNEVTESSYPLWATLDLQIIGAFPASTDMFEDIGKIGKSEHLQSKQKDYTLAKVWGSAR